MCRHGAPPLLGQAAREVRQQSQAGVITYTCHSITAASLLFVRPLPSTHGLLVSWPYVGQVAGMRKGARHRRKVYAGSLRQHTILHLPKCVLHLTVMCGTQLMLLFALLLPPCLQSARPTPTHPCCPLEARGIVQTRPPIWAIALAAVGPATLAAQLSSA